MVNRVRGESSELADDQDEDQDIEKAVSVESAYTHNPLVFDEQDDDLIRDQGTGPSTASTAPRRVKEPKDTNAGFGFVYSPLVAGLGYNDEIPGKATATSPQFPDSGSMTTILLYANPMLLILLRPVRGPHGR